MRPRYHSSGYDHTVYPNPNRASDGTRYQRTIAGQPLMAWARAALHAAIALPVLVFLVYAVLALGAK